MKKNKGKKAKTTDLYEKFKYKTKNKQKAAFGTQLGETRQPVPGEDPSANQIDKMGVQAAGAVNPLFGALAETGIATSKAVRGNALNSNRNTAAEAIDPFGWAKGNQNAGDWAKSIFLGPASWADKGSRRKQAALQNNAAANAAINPSLIANAKLKKGGYVLGGDPPITGDEDKKKNPFYPFTRESWKSQGVLDSLGRGTMLKGSYQNFNKYFGHAIPTGVNPDDETYFGNPQANPSSLQDLIIKKAKPVQFHTVTGETVAHSKMGLKKGGKALASKLNVLDGGSLRSVSPTAVEVEADEPSQQDSVELENAFVDDGEIIDNKNRVFSEELGYAKEAKKLEKQKSKNPRFSAANKHIDSKLDALFQHQEENKDLMARKPKEKVKSMAAGGTYRPESYKRKPNDSVEIGPRATSKHLEPKVRLTEEEDVRNKMSFLEGGYVPPEDRVMITSQQRLRRKAFADGGDMRDELSKDFLSRAREAGTFTAKAPTSSSVSKSKFKAPKINARETAANLATFVPNVVSAFAQRNLKGPVSPILEQSKQLDRVRPDAQLAEIEREGGATNQLIKNNTAQAGDLASAYGNVLAKKIAAKNQVYGQNQALNAEIQGREASLNVPIGARNTDRLNQFRQGQADFSNLQQKLTTENVSNLAGKVLGRVREANLQDLDRFKFGYSQKQFEDSGINRRAYEKSDQRMKSDYDKFMPKEPMKDGGSIHIKKSHRGLLHKNLGVAKGKKIPASKLKVKSTDSAAVKKRKVFAQNAKKWHHK